MKTLLLLLISLLPAHAQNGKILSQTPVVYSDSLKAQRIRSTPRFREVFDKTETLAITYRSWG